MNKETLELTVEGMSCSHCESAVKRAVGALAGVDAVRVDLQSKQVTVDLDADKVSRQMVKDSIEEEGYQVK